MASDPRELSIHERVVVETEVGDGLAAIHALVTNVLPEELWLATRGPEPRITSIAPGQQIHLTFLREDALVAESVFVRRLGDQSKYGNEKSRVFAVQRPADLGSLQRRAHVRVDLERTVKIRALGALGSDKMGTGRTVNVGAGGLLFVTEMPLLFGEQLRVALALTSREIVVANGAVVRIEDAGQAQIGPHGHRTPSALSRVAMRFDRIARTDQERITCHILSAHRRGNKSEPADGLDAGDEKAAGDLATRG